MLQSVSALLLRAKRLEIDAVRQLAERAELADVIGQLIHALQRERGASAIYLASRGLRFEAVHAQTVAEAAPVEAAVKARIEAYLEPHGPGASGSARVLSLMAWVVLGLDALVDLRGRIGRRELGAHEAVAAYSQLIAGMVELVFQVADTAPDPVISRLLVSYLHLVEAKEAAGQERAVGALMFASGTCDDGQLQRVAHLIDAQEGALKVFDEFASPALKAALEQVQLSPAVARLERLRRTLSMTRPGAVLDANLSDPWFDACSERITALWNLQTTLVREIRAACDALVQAAEQALTDSEGLLRQLRDNPPQRAHAVGRFFDASATAPTLAGADTPAAPGVATGGVSASLLELLQAQSARLAGMEAELEAARRALNERKVIERAKGVLMSRMGMSEEAAFKALRKTAMDQNRRLVEIAEATLALPDFAFAGQGGAAG